MLYIANIVDWISRTSFIIVKYKNDNEC